MDRYFLKTDVNAITLEDGESLDQKAAIRHLHLVGVTSMFIASKVEEVYPMKLDQVIDGITHKAFTAR